jgi:hypothetical protein
MWELPGGAITRLQIAPCLPPRGAESPCFPCRDAGGGGQWPSVRCRACGAPPGPGARACPASTTAELGGLEPAAWPP